MLRGMKLWEYDLRLYGELKACLERRAASPFRDQPDDAMWAGLQHSLKTMRVGKPHGCGDVACRSFYTTDEAPPGDLFRVRLDTRGELSLSCDARGTVYYVEWLPDENPGSEVARYTLTPAGWAARTFGRRRRKLAPVTELAGRERQRRKTRVKPS